jgi:hypothetical protein
MSPRREPGNYKPGPKELRWLVSEAPRHTLIFGEIREGRATAAEIANMLWPEVNPYLPDPWLENLSPIAWLTEVLNHEATPCAFGGAGLLGKEGDDYIKAAITHEPRPHNLPRWPSN